MAEILLIDDSWLTRRGLKSMITDSGHTVIEAENGEKGLDMIRTGAAPDCIILDLLMPEMDGYEVLTELKEMGAFVPVIVCSADIQETARSKCMDLGAISFLNKPPKPEEVVAVIDKVLVGND